MKTIQVSETVILREFKTEDAESLFELIDRSRNHLKEWLPWVDEVKSVKDSQGFITFAQEEAECGSSLHLGIFEKGRLAGKVCLYQINDRIKTASIGYYIGADFEGRGLVTQAVKQLAAFAFQTRGLTRLEIKVVSQNKRSLAVPQRLRFSYEGCLRESGEFQGKPADQLIFSLLKREFQS